MVKIINFILNDIYFLMNFNHTILNLLEFFHKLIKQRDWKKTRSHALKSKQLKSLR